MAAPQIILIPLLLPLIGSILIAICNRQGIKLQNTVAGLTVLGTFLSLGWLYLLYRQGTAIKLELLSLLDYGLTFKISSLGILMALLAALLWTLATIYAFVYMQHEHSPGRFLVFLMASLSGSLGVFLAGDYFTLFLFFELMTFAAYPLIIHEENDHALFAGNTYLYLSVAGGLVLLFGILLLVWVTGSASIVPQLDKLLHSQLSPWLIVLPMLIGFAVKAGLVPLHIWLPQAHPVAPSPASAMLSGLMIKTGAFGILRVLTVTLAPDVGHGHAAPITQQIGIGLIWVALATMILGAIMALMQDSIKKILAYSSVSQMGYIMLAIGAAAYLGDHGGLAHSAAVYHILNHAVFKSGLFLMIGTVYLLTHTLSLRELGGLYRYLPFTATTTLVASLAVLGIPGFSGFASKTLIHHAIVEVAHYSHSSWMLLAEKLFMFGTALTAGYFIKLYAGIFLGKGPKKAPVSKEGPLIKVVLLIFTVLIILVGIFPYNVMFELVKPTAKGTIIDMQLIYEQLHHVKFWDAHAYEGVFIPALIGVAIYFVAKYTGFFNWRSPWWLSVEAVVYRPLSRGFLTLCCRYLSGFEAGICQAYDRSGEASNQLVNRVRRLEDAIDGGYNAMGQAGQMLAKEALHWEQHIDDAYRQAEQNAGKVVRGISKVEGQISAGYDKAGETVGKIATDATQANQGPAEEPLDEQAVRRMSWNPQSITFNSLTVAILLLIILLVLYLVGAQRL